MKEIKTKDRQRHSIKLPTHPPTHPPTLPTRFSRYAKGIVAGLLLHREGVDGAPTHHHHAVDEDRDDDDVADEGGEEGGVWILEDDEDGTPQAS